MANPAKFNKQINIHPIQPLLKDFNLRYVECRNNPNGIANIIPTLVDLQTKIREAIKSAPAISTTSGIGRSIYISDADKEYGDTVSKLDEIFKLTGTREPSSASRPAAQPSNSIPAESLAVGFGNMGANCWANALLSMIVFVPSFKEVYKTVADHYAKDGNAEQRKHGAALQKALTEYDRCFAVRSPVPMEISQDVRLVFNHFFGDVFSKDFLRQEDAQEAMQLLMGEYQKITKDKRSHPVLLGPMQTNRLYAPVGAPAQANPNKKDYSKLSLDNSSQQVEPDYQIFLDLQNKAHLSFPALVKSIFCNTAGIHSQSAVYMLPNGSIQNFDVKSEGRHFVEAPKELFITVKRFGSTPEGRGFKITDPVKVDRVVVLPAEATAKNISLAYELDSFITHWGDYGGGHYIDYKKIAGFWVEKNDSVVRIVPEEEIDRILQGLRAQNCTSYIHHYVLIPEAKQAETIAKLSTKVEKESFEKAVQELTNGTIPESVKGTLYHAIWLHLGAENIPNVGQSTYDSNPRILNEINHPWLISGQGNLVQQMLAVQKTKLEIAKNQVYAEHLNAFLQKLYGTCPHAELEQAWKALPDAIRWEIETLLFEAHKIRFGAAHVERPFYGKDALETKNIRDLLTGATEFVRNVYGKNIVEQLAADYRIKAEKLQYQYEADQLKGFRELLNIRAMTIKQLVGAFDRLEIRPDLKLKIYRNIWVANGRREIPDYGRKKFEENPDCLKAINDPLFISGSTDNLLTQLIALLEKEAI